MKSLRAFLDFTLLAALVHEVLRSKRKALISS